MEKKELEKYEKAGQIAASAIDYGKGLIKKGNSLLEVTDKIEGFIIKNGGKLAFPTQMSLNHVAAHFYPDADDKIIFEDQVVKLDVGVHVDGFIGDTACTVDLSGNYSELVKASRDALNNAIKIVKAGVTLGEIGKIIQETISGYGFAPIRNLSGHGLDEYDVHSPPTIPNTATNDKTRLEEGQIIAIEPFASTGAGIVVETSNATLFQMIEHKPVRDNVTREVLAFIEEYEHLPFARRWLLKKFTTLKVNFALKRLLNNDVIRDFPPLADKAKGIVSQAEHTLIVEKDKARILTKV